MKRKLPKDIDLELTEEFIDDFGDYESPQEKRGIKSEKVVPIHEEWNIVKAFNAINDAAPKSQLNKNLFIRCAEAFSFLSDKLGINPVQCVVIAMLIEEGTPMSFRQMGKILGLTRLSMMTYYNDIEELFKMRWLQHRGDSENDGMYDSYALARGVISAIRENRPFEPEVLECKDTQEFVDRLAEHIRAGYNDESLLFMDEKYWLQELVNANAELPICSLANSFKDIDCLSLLMLVVADYANFNGSDNEGIGPRDVQLVYPHETTPYFRRVVDSMQKGTHVLFRENLIEHKCVNGMAETNLYVATNYLKNEILADFNPIDHSNKHVPKMNGVKSYRNITPKALFYNEEEQEQVGMLRNILSQDQLPIIQERLKSKGMRTGVCILMHGQPGTGKTATVYELARQTGRDIIQVQVTDFKDKYVGESEAKLKKIFSDYRQYCMNSEVTPILLLNEGDAILSKRIEKVEHSIEQMMNTLQNILLEEMENIQGIMIVTTNLTSNLDTAFERRFIFKVKFEKPGTEVKTHIWQTLVDWLDEEDAGTLAKEFDVTGGEIENIARKATMQFVLTGKEADIEMIRKFTKQEKLESSRRPVTGFLPNH
ncbi:MAG: AAA family ATPase [Prevotella sp.]|nr:AAA family ATPase [Prevotella sp.]